MLGCSSGFLLSLNLHTDKRYPQVDGLPAFSLFAQVSFTKRKHLCRDIKSKVFMRKLEKCFPTDRVYIVTLQIG